MNNEVAAQSGITTYDVVSAPNSEGHAVADKVRLREQRYVCRGVVAFGVPVNQSDRGTALSPDNDNIHGVRSISGQRRRESDICKLVRV